MMPSEGYPLDLPNYDGTVTTWWFPQVHNPSDTPAMQALRRRRLDSAAARMARRQGAAA